MLYHIHKELQDAAIWTWPISKGQTKVNIELVQDFDVENISANSMKSYRVYKVPDAARSPAQATTIPFTLRGLRGKNRYSIISYR